MVPKTDAAFPLWISMLRRCLMNSVDLGSPVFSLSLLSMSLTRSIASGPQCPRVSKPRGTKLNRPSRKLYLFFFLLSASDAAAPLGCCDASNKRAKFQLYFAPYCPIFNEKILRMTPNLSENLLQLCFAKTDQI